MAYSGFRFSECFRAGTEVDVSALISGMVNCHSKSLDLLGGFLEADCRIAQSFL